MLKIINQDGLILEIPPDQVITVDTYNPLFNDPDTLFQDVGYPGTVPMSENNKLFFGMAHLTEAPKSVYTVPASYYVGEIQLGTGNISLRISSDPQSFETNLEPNFAAINSLLKNVRMTDIPTEDGDRSMISDAAAFEAMMLDTCKNPDKYPYIFFPVANTGMTNGETAQENGDDAPEPMLGFINYYDTTSQQFLTGLIDDLWAAQSPYYKLTYIIKQIAAYLGFSTAGGFFNSSDTKNICIYTRRTITDTYVGTSMYYMPNMLVSDFIKQIRERLHLAMDFNLGTKVLTVETYKTIKNSKKIVDLTPYMTTTMEMEIPEQQGATVTLKTDEQDLQFQKTDIYGNTTSPPLFTLVVGDGSTITELDCSTTNVVDLSIGGSPGDRYPIVKQSVILESQGNFIAGLLPPDLQRTDAWDPTTENNWPLRLFNYDGYLPSASGYFPMASPLDLNQDDIDWYTFSNDSKRLILTSYFPPAVISKLKTTSKCCHRTAGRNFVYYLIEQISCDYSVIDDWIATKLYVRSLQYVNDTSATIIPYLDTSDATPYFHWGLLKAYFDPLLHGINEVDVTIVGAPGDVYTVAAITVPTTIKGAGGVGSVIKSGVVAETPVELRIYRGVPRYLWHQGSITPFAKIADYYTITVALAADFYPETPYVIFF